jgi:hypothetical protein
MTNEERIRILDEKREKIDEISPSFCTAKWLQTTLYLQNGYNHSCHHPSPHKIPLAEIKIDPASLHNSSFKKSQRVMMKQGQRPPECEYCWKIEDLNKNYFSDRHYKTSDTWAWPRFDEIAASDPTINVFPSYLEVSFSNACNFACAYCSPEISSKWMEDIVEYGQYPTEHSSHSLSYLESVGKMPYKNNEENPYVDAFWQWFPEALPNLKVLRITGGEPTMAKSMWRLLDYLIENPNLDLNIAINTNACVDNKLIDKLIEKINKLTEIGISVDIYTSLESIGEQAEYVRDGLSYDQWCRNVHRFLSETSSTVSLMTTINILSLPTFTKFISLIMEFRKIYNKDFAYNRIPLSINYLRWPPHLQATLLDQDTRTTYATEIEEFCEQWLKYYSPELYARIYLEEFDQIKRFCDYLRTSVTELNYRKDFVNYINTYDFRRGKNFAECFPEYKNLLEKWNA